MSKYANPGDKIRIIVPKLFLRCGYPLNPEKILTERESQVEALVAKAWQAMRYPERTQRSNDLKGLGFLVEYCDEIPYRVKHHLTSAVVSMILNCEGFGGRERQVFEQEESPWFKDKVVTVVKKRIVKTGTYFSGNGEDPAYLSDEKVHCVYQFETYEPVNIFYDRLEILAQNVERVTDDFRVHNNRQEEVQTSRF